MSEDTILNNLNPGIRRTVEFLRSHGFATCDSGDGVTKDFTCDPGMPYVHSTVDDPSSLIVEAERMKDLLEACGVAIHPLSEAGEQPYIQADYSPADGIAAITLFYVTDAILFPEAA